MANPVLNGQGAPGCHNEVAMDLVDILYSTVLSGDIERTAAGSRIDINM